MKIRKKSRPVFILATLVLITALSIIIGSIVSDAHTTETDQAYKYYTSIMIQEGDTLWSIADEHMSGQYKSKQSYISEIKKLNHLTNDSIMAGQYLIISYYSEQIY